jgi:hypothetical protein
MGFCRFFGIRMNICSPERLCGVVMLRVKLGVSAHVAQLVERVLGKDEVISSTLIMGSMNVG